MNVKTSQHIADTLCEKIKQKSCICLGFDPVIEQIPDFLKQRANIHTILSTFFDLMLEALHDKIAMIKFQSADFEYFGVEGMKALANCLQKTKDAGILRLLDVKRGDIGRSSDAYANAYLSPTRQLTNDVQRNEFEADAITISPYLGSDSLESFFTAAKTYNKGLFVLLKTSNPGAPLIQDIENTQGSVSTQLAKWLHTQCETDKGKSGFSRIGVVVGATHSHAADFRKLLPHSFFLMPGLGAQGGSTHTVKQCMTPQQEGVIAPVSRALLYPETNTSSAKAYQSSIQQAFNSLYKDIL
ncbi:MAG: orotidine-5'-phosphate decarboxylase [bacterium]